ncbi:MAG: HAMP domain-containing sensor histidine kinase [Rothia sp. (in: high G+C Gram-positive bacteria)]|nr:HAMP domain-containing sensor histidine kinase [Rothia sp. (in: high G+C Gram-positive bacteria)]
MNNSLLRRFGSIPARAGLLSAVVAALAGVLISAAALGALYFSLHGSIQQNLQSRLSTLATQNSSVSALSAGAQETGAGIDLVALFNSSGVVSQSSSVTNPSYPRDIFSAVPQDGVAHSVEGISAGDTEFHALAQRIDVQGHEYVIVAGIEADQDRALYVLAGSILALTVPFFAILCGLLTQRSVRSSLAPVESIRTEVEAITSAELSRRVSEPRTDDEIAALAHTMNSMLERLDNAHKSQLRFLGDASHELRSPIATISGLVEISQLTAEPIDLPSIEHILAPEATRMQRLVDDLLASASAQDEGAPREEVDLDDVVLAEQQRLRALHPEITIDGTITPVRVLGVPDALLRVVRNLADNALKYCVAHVRISLHQSGDFAVISVQDDGAGIPDSAKELVLTRFGRTDASRNRATGGAGLGLAIVNDIVNAHHGSITVHDSPLGGAHFEIKLSCASTVNFRAELLNTKTSATDPSDTESTTPRC